MKTKTQFLILLLLFAVGSIVTCIKFAELRDPSLDTESFDDDAKIPVIDSDTAIINHSKIPEK